MEPSELLQHLVAKFDDLGIDYLVTGSMATITFGEPRFTLDIDVVARIEASQIDAVCAAFPAPGFYLSRQAISDAVRNHSQFNVIHPSSGLKIDVIVADDDEFNRSRFRRGIDVPMPGGTSARFATPEDVILRKLQYYQEGRSEKHVRDIIGVFRISGARIERGYLTEWARKLDVFDTWKSIESMLPPDCES